MECISEDSMYAKTYSASVTSLFVVMGTKGLLVLGDSSATFEEASGLLASITSPAAAMQIYAALGTHQ